MNFYPIDLDQVPSPPAVAARLLEAIQKEETLIVEIIKIISADPGISAKLIAFCNTSSQRRSHEVTNLKQAVMKIGSKRLKLLALSFSLVKPGQEHDTFDYEMFWVKSLANAVACSSIGSELDRPSEEDFLLGLVLNVGQVAFALSAPQQPTIELQSIDECDADAILGYEKEYFGANRFQVSASLLRKWRFPESMCEMIENLTDKECCVAQKSKSFLLYSIKLASLLYCNFEPEKREERIETLAMEAETLFGMTQEAFDNVLTRTFEQWEEYAALLGVPKETQLDPVELEREARNKLVAISMNTESDLEVSVEKNQTLERESNIDELTSVRNRRAYERDAQRAIDMAASKSSPFGVLVMDIDFFKEVNDQYGHAVGDIVLREIGHFLVEQCRCGDRVYRVGGEEFVVLLHGCSYAESKHVAERIRKSLEAFQISIGDDDSIFVTASIGVSWSRIADERPIEQYFEAADHFMYEAKKRGRNQCVFDCVAV